MIVLDLSILNQKGTPMFNSDLTANRPAAGIVGRIFIATDSPFGIFRDTGTAWDQISGASTFSGSLATGQVAFGSATNTISGTNNLFWNSANNRLGIGTNLPTTTLDIRGNSIITSSDPVVTSSIIASVRNSNSLANFEVYSTAKIDIFRNNFTSQVYEGIYIYGASSSFGANNSNRGIVTFCNESADGTLYSGIQAAAQNYGNVRAGIYFTSGAREIRFVSDSTIIPQNMWFRQSGNLVIGSNLDNGFRLQVFGGSTYLGGNLTLSNAGGTSFAYATAGTFLHDAVGTNGQLIYTANDNYRIKFAGGGFGTIIGATGFSQTTNNTLLIQTRVNRNVNILQFNCSTELSTGSTPSTIALNGNVTLDALANLTGGIHTAIKVDETFAPNNTLKDIRYNGVSIQPIINQTGGAVQITRGLIIQPTLTAAADWRSIEWSNNTGWGLYGAGSALNYLGGTLGIKTTSPYAPSTFSLDVNGGLLVKNTAGTTAQITLINADPSIGGNNGFLVASVGGTSGGSFVDFQGYYGTSIVGSTALRLNPAGGAVIVNSTTNTGEQFQLTGSIRINGQSSGSSGGNSGQHLIINLDGTTYKIKLELP